MHDNLPEIEVADHVDMSKARVGIEHHRQFPATNLGLSAAQWDIKGSSCFSSLEFMGISPEIG